MSKVHKLPNQVLKNSQLPDYDLDKDDSELIGLDCCNNDQYLEWATNSTQVVTWE